MTWMPGYLSELHVLCFFDAEIPTSSLDMSSMPSKLVCCICCMYWVKKYIFYVWHVRQMFYCQNTLYRHQKYFNNNFIHIACTPNLSMAKFFVHHMYMYAEHFMGKACSVVIGHFDSWFH